MASGCRLLSRLRVIASGGPGKISGGGAPARSGAACCGPGRAESGSRLAVHASALDVEIPPQPRLDPVGR
eukprot:scaffold69117_cov67-Phaeocystis_antarctica.AAC.6